MRRAGLGVCRLVLSLVLATLSFWLPTLKWNPFHSLLISSKFTLSLKKKKEGRGGGSKDSLAWFQAQGLICT